MTVMAANTSHILTNENELQSTLTLQGQILRHISLDIIETPPAKSTKQQMPSVLSDNKTVP